MRRQEDHPPSDPEIRFSDQMKLRAHRQDIKAFWWGTWLMLIVALGLARDALQGLRGHKWVNIAGLGQASLVVPWWIAAAFALYAFLTTLWCFSRYVKLKGMEC
jgi:hypothetical protein